MPSAPTRLKQTRFYLCTLLLLAAAVAHTLWSTSLDGFTVDEPYHITAGATYLRWGDFRINPEHPPLVKLFVALFETPTVLHVAPFTPLDDKYQERVYTQTAVFLASDYHAVQRRSRTGMILLNTFLLLALTLSLRRVFSPSVALGTLLLLALDPTVSAHMPVVMTDLPLALIGTLTCSLAVLALRCRRWQDWLLFGASAGLLLGTKHSAPLIYLPLLAICVAVTLWRWLRLHQPGALQQLPRILAAILLSFAVLWSLYGFHFHESRNRDPRGNYLDTFNRPLTDKIEDLNSHFLKSSLRLANRAHLVPRAYIWGMADTLRAGVEGRPIPVRAFGHEYFDKAPWWVPFSNLLVKVPLPFFALAIGGIALLLTRKLEPIISRALLLYLSVFILLMAFIAKNGIFYAGLRHWLITVPLLAIPAAICIRFCLVDTRRYIQALPIAALLLIAIPTLPQRRIWEYHNLIAGGSYNAWRGFDNESVDLGQRSDEIFAFCKTHISPAQPMPFYWLLREEWQANGLAPWEPTPEQVQDGYLDGWLIGTAPHMPYQNWKHIEVLRTVQPTARLGNAVFYHGRFYLPHIAGGILIGQAFRLMDTPNGDLAKAELYLTRGVNLNPEATSAFIELGNFALKRGNKNEALRQYRLALAAEDESEAVRQVIRHQITQMESHPGASIPPLRRPSKE